MAKSPETPAESTSLGPLELFIWRDIASHKGAVWSDTPKSGGSWLMYTAGWVTDEDETDLTIHSTIGDPNREPTYGHDTVIPKGCIVKRTILKKRLPKA